MLSKRIESAVACLASCSGNARSTTASARPIARAGRIASVAVLALLPITSLLVTGCDETDSLLAIDTFGGGGFIDDFGSDGFVSDFGNGGFSDDSSGECEFFSSGTICPGGLVSVNLDPVFKSKHASTRAAPLHKAGK